MNKNTKELLLKELSIRAPYGLKVRICSNEVKTVRMVDLVNEIVHFVESDSLCPFGMHIEDPVKFRQCVKPYLRSMNSMTEAEKNKFQSFSKCGPGYAPIIMEWIYEHHLDWNHFIENRLALDDTENLYEV